MNNQEKNGRKFWDRFATFYDRFINKVFRRTYVTILQNIEADLDLNHSVLEIGTGTGIIPFSIYAKVSSIIATDISPGMIQIAKQKLGKSEISNVEFQIQDSNNLPYPDKSFEIVIASNLFHLLYEPEKTIIEVRRVLKDNGILIAPTLCVGENTKSKIVAIVIGFLSGFLVVNKWSFQDFQSMLTNNGLVICKAQRIEGKLLTAYVVVKKDPTLPGGNPLPGK